MTENCGLAANNTTNGAVSHQSSLGYRSRSD